MRVVAAGSSREIGQFISLPWKIYREDPLWVPLLRSEFSKTLRPATNPLLRAGPHVLLLALRDGEAVGRVCAGIDQPFNRCKGTKDGYISLFESVNDDEVAGVLFDAAVSFLRGQGAIAVRGPVSPTNGEDFRGLLVHGFEHRPVLYQSYNHPYYGALFERFGFTPYLDYFGFRYDQSRLPDRARVVRYAKDRYGFDTHAVDLKVLDRDLEHIHRVMHEAMPTEWPDLIPPDLGLLKESAADLRRFADPELVRIARLGDRPIGLLVALPDYNQVLSRMNGKIFPTGWVHYLRRRRIIDTIRFSVVFIVPEFQGKGVLQALYYDTVQEALRLGYRWAEGSSALDSNSAIIRENLSAGGEHIKTYRIYRKEFD